MSQDDLLQTFSDGDSSDAEGEDEGDEESDGLVDVLESDSEEAEDSEVDASGSDEDESDDGDDDDDESNEDDDESNEDEDDSNKDEEESEQDEADANDSDESELEWESDDNANEGLGKELGIKQNKKKLTASKSKKSDESTLTSVKGKDLVNKSDDIHKNGTEEEYESGDTSDEEVRDRRQTFTLCCSCPTFLF